MITFKHTTKGTMSFLSVKAFGYYLNASWGKSSKKVSKPNPKAWLGEWTMDGYCRYMDNVTEHALWDVVLKDVPEINWVHGR